MSAVAWWEGLPGMDWRYLPPDQDFGNRVTAIACAQRCHGEPVAHHRPPGREVENTADLFFGWLQRAGTAWEGYVRRLSLAMACAGPAAGMKSAEAVKHAEWFHRYLTKEASSHGGWV